MLNINNNYAKNIIATISPIIVAIIFSSIICLVIMICFSKQINLIFSIVNMISIENTDAEEITEIKFNNNKLSNYPKYGENYGKIIINSIDVDLPLYYGETLDILKKGVGHSSGSYFPGEGKSIILMGHNSTKVFRRFSELKVEDEILLNTNYGNFKYKIYDMKIIKETDLQELPIQDEKEILMVYTCYPLNNIGYAYQRYVVYANLVEENGN